MGNVIEEAVDALRAAFPPQPLDPDRARDEWHVGTIHTTGFMDAVRGKPWVLGPNALVAVLPAFLAAMLRRAPELHMVPTFLLGTLTREPATAQRFDARLGPLTLEQRRAIARALATWEASPQGADHRDWTREARNSYWRGVEA
jgi:hypothetical protein